MGVSVSLATLLRETVLLSILFFLSVAFGGFFGGGGGAHNGPYIIPGTYTVSLATFDDGVITELGEESATGIKNVSGNEPFFEGHFPEYPIMPGVLIAEALAQTGAVLIMNSFEEPKKNTLFPINSQAWIS